MKKTAILMSALLALSVMGCKDDNSKKSEESKQEQQKDPQKDEPKGPTQEELNKQHDDALMTKVGKACDTYMGSCFSDNSKVLACTDTDSDEDTKWRVIDCDTDAYCVEENGYAICAEKCNPNAPENKPDVTCESNSRYMTPTYSLEQALCQLAPGSKNIYVETYNYEFCSDCSTDNLGTCTVKDSDKGLNLKAGDACNPALFASRCDGNKAINCVVIYNDDNNNDDDDIVIAEPADVEVDDGDDGQIDIALPPITAKVVIEECASECQVLNVISNAAADLSNFYAHPGKLAVCSNMLTNKSENNEISHTFYNKDNGTCYTYFWNALLDDDNNCNATNILITTADSDDACSDLKNRLGELVEDPINKVVTK